MDTQHSVFITLADQFEESLNILREKSRMAEKELFETLTTVFFNLHPEIKTIYWNQYVPGFNDGDPCEFTMGDIHFTSADWQEVDSSNFYDESEDNSIFHYGMNSWQQSDNIEVSEQLQNDIDKLTKVLSGVEDHLQRTFDSNAFVRIHRDGVEVEEYDCGY